jgi:WD40 repeat protein
VLSADGTRMAAAMEQTIHVWDAATGKVLLQVAMPGLQAPRFGISADGSALLAANWQDTGCTVRQWNLATGKELSTQSISAKGARRLRPMTFSPDGTTLAVERAFEVRRPLKGGGVTVGTGYQIVLVDPITGQEQHRLDAQDDVIWGAAFTADSKTVGWIGMDYSAGVAEVATGKLLRRLQGAPGCARPDGHTTLALSPDGKILAAVGSSAAVQVWDLTTGRDAIDTSVGHQDALADLVFTADGRTLISGSADRTIRLWDLTTGQQRQVLHGHPREVRALSLSSDGATLASADQDSGIHLWDLTSGKELRRIQAVKAEEGVYFGLSPLLFTSDGKALLSWGDDQRLHRWDVATGKELAGIAPVLAGLPPAPEGRPKKIPSFEDQVAAVAFRPDGRIAAVVGGSSLYLVDTATGHQLFKIPGIGTPCRLAFSPDGRTLFSGGWDKEVRLWEVATGKELFRKTRLDYVNALAFAADGRTVAAATGWLDARIHLFDVATGQELHRFEGPGSYVDALAFAPDGKTLASGQRDTTILLWDCRPVRRPGLPARDLGPGDLDRLWADLAGADAGKAHTALWTLVAVPGHAVPFLKEHLRPAESTDPKRIRQWIADLDSEKFAVREAALKEVQTLGAEAYPALREALKQSPTPEVRKRIEALLAGPPTGDVPRPEVLRGLRAAAILEQIGSPEARLVLEALARGVPVAVETREAAAALERLRRRADSRR